ncbi:bombyxin B-1 homolog [Plutella xylostella]|uniref:bombyxin B-1 homolog n=1 Tax=Plutella xylostella TaxID=51655 RepID=UPI0005D0B556|nr:bombyxin B-1 homolog [Plutella xylostella]
MSLKIVTVLVLVAVTAEPSSGQAQMFCGRKLADTLGMLCENGLLLEKKSAPSYNSIYGEDLPKYGWPWMSKHRAQALEMPSRGKRHVVDECCLKPCTIDELLTYCA